MKKHTVLQPIELVWIYMKTVFFTALILGLLTTLWGGSLGFTEGYPLHGLQISPRTGAAFCHGALLGLPAGLFIGTTAGALFVGPLQVLFTIFSHRPEKQPS